MLGAMASGIPFRVAYARADDTHALNQITLAPCACDCLRANSVSLQASVLQYSVDSTQYSVLLREWDMHVYGPQKRRLIVLIDIEKPTYLKPTGRPRARPRARNGAAGPSSCQALG